MSGQLCWIPKIGSNGELSLYLRLNSFSPWKPHTAYPGLCVPDYPIERGSKGWATSQKLLQSGWTVIPASKAQSSFYDRSSAA
jgi:hypothetical protein